MTPARIARLAALQEKWRDRTDAEQAELDGLRIELARNAEVADDPRTPFTNEARSPNLDGSDFLEQLRQRECERLTREAIDFAARWGIAALQAAVQAAITGR